MRFMMKKYMLLQLICLLCLLSCAKKNDFANINEFFTNWSVAVKNLDVKSLNKMENVSKLQQSYDIFYGEFYFKNIIVLNIKDMDKYFFVKFNGLIFNRFDNSSIPFFATAELVKVKNNFGYEIKNKTIYRSK